MKEEPGTEVSAAVGVAVEEEHEEETGWSEASAAVEV